MEFAWNESEEAYRAELHEVLSTLPESHPGHALLTEDLGRVVHVDDCPCGRLGQTLVIEGRVPKAELRGCSDTAA